VFEFEAERIMTLLREFLDRSVVQKTKGVFVFEVTNAAKKKKTWTLDLKNNDGALYEGLPTAPAKADATLALSDEDFKRLVYNETQPQKLFLTGRLKVKGNLALALKFEGVLRSLEDKARAKL
jgi:putative sterol carrier protein